MMLRYPFSRTEAPEAEVQADEVLVVLVLVVVVSAFHCTRRFDGTRLIERMLSTLEFFLVPPTVAVVAFGNTNDEDGEADFL
mmetsp:Transcript_20699/g.23143  ORF Transcript_20699/g.23143 Transcript_20699/m.23143 type:complete len:82 (-) Transcript_20699:370-615(-)